MLAEDVLSDVSISGSVIVIEDNEQKIETGE
jgi:hypothetical protein